MEWGLEFVLSLKWVRVSDCNSWFPLADQRFYPSVSSHPAEQREGSAHAPDWEYVSPAIFILLTAFTKESQGIVALLSELWFQPPTLMENVDKKIIHFYLPLCNFSLPLIYFGIDKNWGEAAVSLCYYLAQFQEKPSWLRFLCYRQLVCPAQRDFKIACQPLHGSLLCFSGFKAIFQLLLQKGWFKNEDRHAKKAFF